MHTGPMRDSDGVFDEWKTTTLTCRKCVGANVVRRVWESSCGGYEDDQYHCNDCGNSWWVEGPDA